MQHFIDVELPEMLELKQKYGTVAIANLGGHSEEEYVEGAAMLSESAVDIVELNISCPNVKVGGMEMCIRDRNAVRAARVPSHPELRLSVSIGGVCNVQPLTEAIRQADARMLSLIHIYDLGILTVGIVTKPFSFEGTRKMGLAEQGIANLLMHVDSLIEMCIRDRCYSSGAALHSST